MLYFQRIIFAGSYDCDVSSMFIVIGLNRKYEISLVSPRDFGTQTYPNDAKCFKICKDLKCGKHCQVPYSVVIKHGLMEHFPEKETYI